MQKKISKLLQAWRDRGPRWWAQSQYGWIMPNGKPVVLSDWQRTVLEAWWAHREDVTTLAISNIKKTGKTTLNAILLCYRWLTLPGLHLAAGNDLDQSQGRQFLMISEMMNRHSLLNSRVHETQKKLEFTPTGSVLEAIETDATGRAGSNHWTASHTEAWGIIYESGIRLYEELTPPPGKWYGLPSLRIIDSYAGWENESKTWHNLVDRGLSGERLDERLYKQGQLLLFHREGEKAQRECFRGTEKERKAYYEEQRETLRAGTFARLHLNQRASGEERFVTLEQWDSLVDENAKPLTPGDPMLAPI